MKEQIKFQSDTVAIIGGGIVGLAIASELAIRFRSLKFHLFEKETSLGLHASTRNSGVLHAGFYYSPDSLKAELTFKGNQKLKIFMKQHGVPLEECGKVVVSKNLEEDSQIEVLHRRSKNYGIPTTIIDQNELSNLEPLAKTYQTALWSPQTAIADNYSLIRAFQSALPSNVSIYLNSRVESVRENQITFKTEKKNYRHIINAAGTSAYRLAFESGFAQNYRLLAFRGSYLQSKNSKFRPHRLIYPVPSTKNPFLGIHLDRVIGGGARIGPTALPVLGRENYSGFKHLNSQEIFEFASAFALYARSNFGQVITFAGKEISLLVRKKIEIEMKKIVPSFELTDFSKNAKPGIRAQLFDTNTKNLEMDFVLEGDENITHILNAVSPAWTGCLSFAELVCEHISRLKVFQ